MSDLLSNVPAHLAIKIRAGLLRVHSKRLEGAEFGACLQECFDTCINVLQNEGQGLTDEILCELIPGWIFHWAIDKGWVANPSRRAVKKAFVTPHGVVLEETISVKIPVEELDVKFGGYWIPSTCKTAFVRSLAGRIAYWQAEALVREPIESDHIPSTPISVRCESIAVQLQRLREQSRLTVEKLAELVNIDSRSVERHLAGKAQPRIGHIGAYERAFTEAIGINVVINKTPLKRR
jgi:hypothetical protein